MAHPKALEAYPWAVKSFPGVPWSHTGAKSLQSRSAGSSRSHGGSSRGWRLIKKPWRLTIFTTFCCQARLKSAPRQRSIFYERSLAWASHPLSHLKILISVVGRAHRHWILDGQKVLLLHTKGGGWGRGAVKLPMTNTSICIITDRLAVVATNAVAALRTLYLSKLLLPWCFLHLISVFFLLEHLYPKCLYPACLDGFFNRHRDEEFQMQLYP